MKPRLLDLFCCQGGASMGYHRAGFEVVGVDINPQPRYPFQFHQADALAFVKEHGHEFDAIHASPPCHDHTALKSVAGLDGTGHLLSGTREALKALGKPYVIENVPGAPMESPLVLCGSQFGLTAEWEGKGEVYLKRHRLFESNYLLMDPGPHDHSLPAVPVYGHGVGGNRTRLKGPGAAKAARDVMGIDWMDRKGLDQALPPAYTEYIGSQLISQL